MRERGLATSVYVMGQYIGTALFSGLLLWMATAMRWRSVFYVTGGIGSDAMIRRGISLSFARKAPLVVGSLMGTTIVLANVVTSDVACIAILTCAFFEQGVSATSWAAVSEVAPVQYIGLTSGITSLAAILAGIVTPIVTGFIVHETGSFTWALNFVGMIALVGALSYSVLLGRLHRIVIETE